MPHTTMMNGMTSHAFAAIMTATVVIFPTPSDLWHTVFPEDGRTLEATTEMGGIDRQPLFITATSTEDQIRSALERCAVIYSTSAVSLKNQCEEVLRVASDNFQNIDFPGGDNLEEKLFLAETSRCRNLWVEGQQRKLDTECQNDLPILAVRN